jgi:hypothetical protein
MTFEASPMTYRPKSTFKGVSIKLLFEQLLANGHSAIAAHALLVGMLEHPGTETEPVLPAWWKLELNGGRIAIKTPAGSVDPAEVFARKNGLAVNGPPPAGGTVFIPSAEDWRKYGAQAPDIWRLRAAQEEYARRKAASQPAGKEPEPIAKPGPEPSPTEPIAGSATEPVASPPAEPAPEPSPAVPVAGYSPSEALRAARAALIAALRFRSGSCGRAAPSLAETASSLDSNAEKAIVMLRARLKPDNSVKLGDHKTEIMEASGVSSKLYDSYVWPKARERAGLSPKGKSGPKNQSGNNSRRE